MRFLVVCEIYGQGFYTKGMADGLERLGHDVMHVTANTWGVASEPHLQARIDRNDNALLSKVREFGPDVLFMAKGDAISERALGDIKGLGVLTVVWQIDDPMLFDRVSLRYSRGYDKVYTTEKNSIPLYRDHGIKASWLPFGYDEDCHGRLDGQVALWSNGSRNGMSKYPGTDVAFVGDPLVNHPRSKRYEMCMEIKDAVPSLKLLGCDMELEQCQDWGARVELKDMETVVSRTKVNLAFADQADGGSGMKMRHIEIPGYGGFMLTEDFDYLGELFERGEEVETFSSAAECVEKIDYYLHHDKQREDIRRAGQKRAMFDHTYTERAIGFVKDIWTKMNS